jgi:aryl-alcohol dehydrogenase
VTVGDANPRLLVPELVTHYQAGRFPFDRLLSFYPFADINEAIGLAASGQAIKPVLRVR